MQRIACSLLVLLSALIQHAVHPRRLSCVHGNSGLPCPLVLHWIQIMQRSTCGRLEEEKRVRYFPDMYFPHTFPAVTVPSPPPEATVVVRTPSTHIFLHFCRPITPDLQNSSSPRNRNRPAITSCGITLSLAAFLMIDIKLSSN